MAAGSFAGGAALGAELKIKQFAVRWIKALMPTVFLMPAGKTTSSGQMMKGKRP